MDRFCAVLCCCFCCCRCFAAQSCEYEVVAFKIVETSTTMDRYYPLQTNACTVVTRNVNTSTEYPPSFSPLFAFRTTILLIRYRMRLV
ncbi:hypothetical protein PF011_g32518 [Phytophthora fragariae]|uniref:Secreted protein n=1 Tax=Phytophthora fragariae TaxID=53985 RepID=A0A6A3G855_9STRA|nr:hypothetical protein PF011_g32518 [Phytophthora fragariae]